MSYTTLLFAITYQCDHPQTCALIEQVLLENKQSSDQTKLIFKVSGDPHHYRPSSNEIKDALKSKHLILSPIELSPWLRKIKNQKAFQLTISEQYSKKYKATKEQIAHFWIYPDITCDLKNQIRNYLNFPHQECSKIIDKIKSERYVILSHSALAALLNYSEIKNLSLLSTSHHQSMTGRKMKNLIKVLKSNESVIWVEEKGIQLPQKIKSLQRKSDQIIRIDHLDPRNSDYNWIKKMFEAQQ